MSPQVSRRNARTGLVLAGVVVGMVGLAFASVPLYQVFCQVTGFGGTTQVATAAPADTLERTMAIRFDAGVDPKLPWRFQPNQRQITLRVGETGQAVYTARNLADTPVTGAATFNVTPLKAGKYFSKIQCFCFDEQRLATGEEAEMGVTFFVDPAIIGDRNLDDVKTITLSYTFFRIRDDGAKTADGVTAQHAGSSSAATN